MNHVAQILLKELINHYLEENTHFFLFCDENESYFILGTDLFYAHTFHSKDILLWEPTV